MEKSYDYDNMIKERLNLKMKSNIVYNYNSNDVYIINQNGELFKKSDPSKKSWRHYINGGKVSVLNPQYFASYNFDFGNAYHEKSLIYFSFEDNSGINFKSFIMKIKLGDDNKFLWTNGLEVNNIKDKLKDIEKIQIVDTTVDNILVKEVLTLFPKLKYVEFISCVIKDECNFNYSFTGEINFKESLIENFRSFRNSMNNFKFNYSQVLNYSCCDVMSKELEFFHSNIDFYQLFLKTNFMNLENLIIETPTKYDQYGGNYQADFKNGFFYLPYSAPNIVRLRIEGSVDNLDFITRLSFLNKVSVVSSSGDMAMEYLEINDKNKENDLIRRNKNAVEIKKILFCDEDDNQEKYYATESEMERVLKLNSIYKILSFTPEEKRALEDKYLYGSSYINFLLNESFIKLDGYYNNYYDRLLFHQIDKRDEVFDRLKLCYQHHALFYEDKDRKIVEAKKTLFYIDGRPIVLNRSYKPIKTVEEAKEFIARNGYKEFDDDITKEYLEDVKKVVLTLEKSGQLADIDMQDLLFFISEEGRNVSLNLIYKDLLNRLNSGHEIFYKLYINNQQWKYNRHITDTICKCQKALYKMIDSRFSSFSKEELLLIGKDFYDESIFIPYLNVSEINIEEEKVRNSINMKCNNNYTKLLESIDRLHEITHKIFDKKYVVTKEELEKIKTLTLRKK